MFISQQIHGTRAAKSPRTSGPGRHVAGETLRPSQRTPRRE